MLKWGFTFFLYSSIALGSYKLSDSLLTATCPFHHTDSYALELNRLHSVIEQQLKLKIDGHARCDRAFTDVSQSLDVINGLFDRRVNPTLREDIEKEVLAKQVDQLKLDLMLQLPGSQSFFEAESQLRRLQEELFRSDINKRAGESLFVETRKNESLRSLFNHTNNIMMSLSSMPAECIDRLGGWHQVLPTILDSISTMSGLSGFAYSAAIGGGLKILSSLALLLKDIKVKTALKDLITHKNSKILACLYYSVQFTACEYRRALKISKQKEKIIDIINQKYSDEQSKIFDEFFYLADRSKDLESIFFEIASMGSAITLDVNLIGGYFIARKASPETLLEPSDIGPPPSADDNSDSAEVARQAWLIKVRTRGISFRQTTSSGIKPLKDQVDEALLDIAKKISDIKAVEELLTSTRSFVDLRHELDTNPNLLGLVQRFKAFFERVLEGEVVQTSGRGVVASAQIVLLELEHFLNLKYDHYCNTKEKLTVDNYKQKMEAYTSEVNKRGRKLFNVMSRGAVAQINRQSVLSIGATVQKRINRAFRLIEDEFLRAELRSPSNNTKVRFSDYKRDKSIMMQVINNYQNFNASKQTFRSEDVEVLLSSIEKGFASEIKDMVARSLKTEARFYPELEGKTAAHLCALFSLTLRKEGISNIGGRKLFRKCRKRFKKLDMLKILKPSKLPIQWDEPCYYSRYRNLMITQNSIYQEMIRVGLASSVRR